MLLIGLTGGIGSGKSTAAATFQSLGVPVIDADEISHNLLHQGSTAFDQVRQAFGETVVDENGDIDRVQLRERVFSDPRRRIELEGILHPLVREEMLRQAGQQKGPYTILMIPLLVETGQIDLVDKIVVVEIPEHLQIQRTMGRDELSIAEVEMIMKAQADIQTRRAVADYVIDNGEDMAHLQRQVIALHKQFLQSVKPELIQQKSQSAIAPQPVLQTSNHRSAEPLLPRPKPRLARNDSVNKARARVGAKPKATGPALSEDVIYELPLHERMRSFIRLENLFAEIAYYLKGDSLYDSRAAMNGIISLLQVFARPDVKNDLVKEIERLNGALSRYAEMSGVDESYLKNVLAELSELSKRLYNIEGQVAQQLRQNELINTIKQRESIPGGTFSVDVPFYGHWLMQDAAQRKRDVQHWLSHFEVVKKATELVLSLIRQSAMPEAQVAHLGFYQKTMDTNLPYQLVRILLPRDSHLYPEISGGRHRFSVRFLQTVNFAKPTQIDNTVNFKLACCVL